MTPWKPLMAIVAALVCASNVVFRSFGRADDLGARRAGRAPAGRGGAGHRLRHRAHRAGRAAGRRRPGPRRCPAGARRRGRGGALRRRGRRGAGRRRRDRHRSLLGAGRRARDLPRLAHPARRVPGRPGALRGGMGAAALQARPLGAPGRGAARGVVDRGVRLINDHEFRCSTQELVAAALAGASRRGYDSVRQPVEGTILTVVREMAGAASHAVARSGFSERKP